MLEPPVTEAPHEVPEGGVDLAIPELEIPPEIEITVEPEPAVVEEIVKPRLRDRLGRTRSALSGYLKSVRGHKIDDSTWDDLEEALLLADVGVPTSTRLLDAVRDRAKTEDVTDADALVGLLRAEVVELLHRCRTARCT